MLEHENPIHPEPEEHELITEIERRERVLGVLQEYGINRHTLTPLIEKRLSQLDTKTQIFEDEHRSAEYARALFRYWNAVDSDLCLTPDKQLDVFVGIFFSDIGKTGPAEATDEQSDAITRMYHIDDPFDLSSTVIEFLKAFFPESRDEMINLLSQMDVSPEMTMRSFYNRHAFWSAQIIRDSHLPKNGVAAALAHHILEGNLPAGIGQDGTIHTDTGDRDMDQRELSVLITDRYDARRRRGEKSHAQAIAWLKDTKRTAPQFERLKPRIQALYLRCVYDLDASLKVEKTDENLLASA